MIELIRNCSHGSEIATYFVNNEFSEKKIIKVATTSSGVQDLIRENDGWNWYQKIRYPQKNLPVCKIIQHRNSYYFKIQIEYIEGSKVDYRKGLEKNAGILKEIVEHYCCIWPYTPNTLSPFHGDLSLDNVVYNSEGIHIIDWEHFNLKGAPWGFDVIYLLFETLYFGMRKRKRPSHNEISIIVDNIKFLNNSKRLYSQITEYPLKYTIDYITSNTELWGEQFIAFPDKLPILTFTDDQISLIDNMVSSKL
jgi:hypothetical protein